MPLIRTLAALILCSAALSAGAQQTTKALDAEIQRDQQLHNRVVATLHAEQARVRKQLCPKAVSTLDINTCLYAELQTTTNNYLALVRAIGALLRSGDDAPKSAPVRLPFDNAEDTWHLYLKQACDVDADQYNGGTIQPSVNMGCQITITQHHMAELGEIYSDLGTR